MAVTARQVITDAMQELNIIPAGVALSASEGQFGLTRIQNQIDAWGADHLTIAISTRTLYTLPSGTSTVSIGSGGTIDVQRPDRFIAINYIVPSSSPAVEVPIGEMDDDSYANLSVKSLSSSLPTQFYYSLSSPLGELFFWPKVSQNVQLALYYPDAIGQPTTLDSTLIGPPGYQEAFMYQLALRLCTPYGRTPPPLLQTLATEAYARIKRPNTHPGLLGIDPGLHPTAGGTYNIVTDSQSGQGNG